jgi:lipoprotein-anchoring transpeptidase ErfK/SrfK
MMKRQIMQASITLGMVAAALGMTGIAPPAHVQVTSTQPAVRLVADLSDKILYLYDGTAEPQMFDISNGRDAYPTPTGKFKIRKLTWNPSWTPPDSKWARNKTAKAPGSPGNPMKVVKIFFKEPDYYIHGTDDIGSLGAAESHGCLRMSPDDVMVVGKFVMDHGGQPQEENWFKRILHSRREEKVIYLTNPVPITVQE